MTVPCYLKEMQKPYNSFNLTMIKLKHSNSSVDVLTYKNSNSFLGKTRVILVLSGIIPFLLLIYLFTYENIELTETILLFSGLSLFSILTGFSLLRKSADQLVRLSRETSPPEAGEKSEPIEFHADLELNDIADHFNKVTGELRKVERSIKEQSTQLMNYANDLTQSYISTKKEEELRDRLSRYVGKHLVEKLINLERGVFLKNERREVTVLFNDIRSYTAIAENMAVEDVISMLNQFFDTMVDIVFKNSGILDKFVGDELMAVFGLIPSENSAPYDAVQAAIEMQNAAEKMMKKRAKEGLVTFKAGIGINTGLAVVGNVGSRDRMDYTVIGDTVNTAGRLQGLAGGSEIIISEETYSQTQTDFRTQKMGEINVKNRIEPVKCYKVIMGKEQD